MELYNLGKGPIDKNLDLISKHVDRYLGMYAAYLCNGGPIDTRYSRILIDTKEQVEAYKKERRDKMVKDRRKRMYSA